MPKILIFEKPKKINTTEIHNELNISDSDVPGTYAPNMSAEDNHRWKAKHIKGKDERIEIRKAFSGTQVVIIVYKNGLESDWKNNVKGHKNVRISANGKINMDLDEYVEFALAIDEAFEILKLI